MLNKINVKLKVRQALGYGIIMVWLVSGYVKVMIIDQWPEKFVINHLINHGQKHWFLINNRISRKSIFKNVEEKASCLLHKTI